MQSAISRDKLGALILLVASTFFGIMASGVSPLAERPEADLASGKLVLSFALAGSLIALLMLISPGKDHRGPTILSSLRRLSGLAVLIAAYAMTLETLGFLVTTSLFLACGYLLLGERRWWPVLMTSVPVAAILAWLLYFVFGITIADPLLSSVGLIA